GGVDGSAGSGGSGGTGGADASPGCGETGQPCCDDGAGYLVCDASSIGKAWSWCDERAAGGPTCVPCGGDGQICCNPLGVCNPGMSCAIPTNKMVPLSRCYPSECGQPGQECCWTTQGPYCLAPNGAF